MIRSLNAFAILIAASSSALAAVDQEFAPPTGNTGGNVGASNAVDWAQTFTVGSNGILTGFDVWLGRRAGVSLPLLYDLRRTSSGIPVESDSSADILASGTIAAATITSSTTVPPTYRMYHVELGSQSITVANDEVLALVLRSDDPGVTGYCYAWQGGHQEASFPYTYSRGNAFARQSGTWVTQPIDMLFRTYAVPEPSTILLATAGIPLLFARRRKPTAHNRV